LCRAHTEFLTSVLSVEMKAGNSTTQNRIVTGCGLINDGFSETDCIAPNDGVISELWIEKDVEESGHGLT
jgi:hypothetical protein